MEKYIDDTFKKGEDSQNSIKQTYINMGKYIDDAFKKEEKNSAEKSRENSQNIIREERRENERIVLNAEVGEQNAKKVNAVYSQELKKFLDSFDRSDIYFRQIVKEKATWQIKEFCIDLEKQAKNVGAQSMAGFANRVGSLFVYNKLDMLPTYTTKYHMELKKLITEIKTYLNSL